METIDVSLPEPMKRWIQIRVESGLYADASDYVRDLIRHDRREAVRNRTDERLTVLIMEGLDDLAAGRIVDADDVFDRLEAKYARLERGGSGA